MTLINKAEALAVLRKAQVASCTCQIKTPDPEWHSHNCRYRILREAEAMIDHLPDALCTCTADKFCSIHAPRTSPPVTPLTADKVLSEEAIQKLLEGALGEIVKGVTREVTTHELRQVVLEEVLAVAESACEEYSTAEHVIGAIRRLTQPEPAPEWTGPGETPHTYSPDYMAMGDCRICGHTRGAHE